MEQILFHVVICNFIPPKIAILRLNNLSTGVERFSWLFKGRNISGNQMEIDGKFNAIDACNWERMTS